MVKTEQEEQLRTLREIRSIMDRSTRYDALSGLSGIFVGLIALAGAGAVQWYLSVRGLAYPDLYQTTPPAGSVRFALAAAVVVFILAAGTALYFTLAKSRKAHQTVWTSQAKRLLVNFCLPMAVGGVFCAILVFHDAKYLVAPAMLVFYGLSLVNASKFTFSDLRVLGVGELALGLIGGFLVQYGLLAWTLGFGLLHVVFGSVLYYKYEKLN